MSTPTTTVLITGGNRGIGRGFVETFLARPSTKVVVAVRDPSHPTSESLKDLRKAAGAELIIVKLDSTQPKDAAEAVATLREQHAVSSLDVVIANAGIAIDGTTVRESTADNITQHLLVNAVGPIMLFQAAAELLRASKIGNPLFIAISTILSSFGSMEAIATSPPIVSPYGGSKATLNWFIRRLHFEEPWLTSFVFHPGLVETDLAAASVAGSSFKLADLGAISVETSVAAMTKIIDTANRDMSGTFRNYDGNVLPW